MASLTVVTPPASEPVTLSDAKLWMRVDDDEDDALIQRLLRDARRRVEEWARVACLPQTLRWAIDGPPVDGLQVEAYRWWAQDGPDRRWGRIVELPRYPLISVTSITGYNDDGTSETMSPSAYWVDTNARPGKVGLKSSSVWPIMLRAIDGLVFVYQAGWPDAASVPEEIKEAILVTAADQYENREGGRRNGRDLIPPDAQDLLGATRTVLL